MFGVHSVLWGVGVIPGCRVWSLSKSLFVLQSFCRLEFVAWIDLIRWQSSLSAISPFIFTLLLSSAQLAVSKKTTYLALDFCNMCLHIVFPLLMLVLVLLSNIWLPPVFVFGCLQGPILLWGPRSSAAVGYLSILSWHLWLSQGFLWVAFLLLL